MSELVYRLIAVVLGVVATGVALHFVFEAFYEDLVDTGQVWSIINYFTATALLAAMAANCCLKRGVDPGGSPVSREYLAVSLGLYPSIVAALLFCRNWFGILAGGAEEQLSSGTT